MTEELREGADRDRLLSRLAQLAAETSRIDDDPADFTAEPTEPVGLRIDIGGSG